MSSKSSPEFKAKVAAVRGSHVLLDALTSEQAPAQSVERQEIESVQSDSVDIEWLMSLGVEIAESATSAGVTKDMNLFERISYKSKVLRTPRSRLDFSTNGWLLRDATTTIRTSGGQWFDHGLSTMGRTLGADGTLYSHGVPDSIGGGHGRGLILYELNEGTYEGLPEPSREDAVAREINEFSKALAEFVVRTQII